MPSVSLSTVRPAVSVRIGGSSLSVPIAGAAAAVRSDLAALRSETAATRAEIAAALGGFKATDTTDGLANTFSGEDFWIDNGDGTASTYRNVAGSAVLLGVSVIDPTATFNLLMAQISPSASDQSATFQSLVDAAAAANQDVNILRPGIYKVADVTVPARADGKSLKIRNAKGTILDGMGADHMLILDGCGVDFEGGAVQNVQMFAGAVETASVATAAEHYPATATVTGPIDKLRIVDVDFGDSVKIPLFYVASTLTNVVDQIELRGWNIEAAWCVANVSAPFRNLKIDDIEMADLDPTTAVGSDGANLSGIFGGIKIGRDEKAAQALTQRMEVNRVTCIGLADDRDDANGDYNTNAINIHGRNLHLTNIRIEEVSNRRGTDCEGIYLKVINWLADNIDMLNAGLHGGMFLGKGDNYAEEADGDDKAIGRGGLLINWRATNTRAFADVHPVYGYDYLYDHPVDGPVGCFPAVFIQHDEMTVGQGVVTGCGADHGDFAPVYTADSRTLDDVVVRDVTFRDCIGRSNINIAHNGKGGGVYGNNSYGQTGAQLTPNSDVDHVRVCNQGSGDLADFRVEGNYAYESVANGTGKSHNIHVVALSGKRIRGLTVLNNRGRLLDYGDRIEVEGGAPAGTLADLHHDGANYRFNVTTPVSISDDVLWPRVGPNSTNFMVGSSTVDLASKAAGATSTFNITVPGARVGDDVTVTPGLYVAGHDAKAVISADDTARTTVTNNTGGTFDAPSQAYRASVSRNRSNG